MYLAILASVTPAASNHLIYASLCFMTNVLSLLLLLFGTVEKIQLHDWQHFK